MSNPCKKCGGTDKHKDGRCVPCQRERTRKWNAAHPETTRKANEKWQNAHPEKMSEAHRKWINANPEKVREYSRNWGKAHPETTRAINQRRRGRVMQSDGSFTSAEWKALVAQYDGHCCYPGCERTDLHADHVVPLAKGGSNTIDNIQPLCAYHNQSKGTKSADYRNKAGLIRWIQSKLFG